MVQLQPDQPPDDLDEARLETALRHAFVGAELLTPPPGSDAAARSGSAGSEDSTLATTDRGATQEHDELPAGVILQGRYRVDATLARGGIGVLFAARDLVLERPVAIKVLQHRHRRRASLVRRLLREAEIGAQLQHPGIVPVHDVGATPDGRPFVAMKLVQGRTFAELLAERGSPSEERTRLLGVFLTVCQTMAYAHARGVVHRDLKPANVMVGAFGEVQVMDWGMAKMMPGERSDDPPPRGDRQLDLSQTDPSGSASVAGAVLGTYAYMPPEQARGEVQAAGPRADVFSLGAILCEILAGSPPYGRGNADEIGRRAAASDLALARSLLAACDVEPELVKLCARCLEPEPAARPAHAGVVAEELSRQVAAVDERTRHAELLAAKAEARATAERRARRWQLLLFGALLVLTLVGAAVFAWQARQRHLRTARATQAVDGAMEGARATQARLRRDGGDAVGWAGLITAAHGVRDLAASSDADDATRQRAASFLCEVESAHAADSKRRAQAAADDRMRDRLRALRIAGASHWQWDRLHAGYAEAFRDYGIDCERLDEAEIARAIRASAIAADLIVALADWRGRVPRGTRATMSDRLDRLLDALDDDPLRRQIRTARRSSDRAALRALASSLDAEGTPPLTILALASGLDQAGDIPMAIDLVRRALPMHPADFWLNFYLGQLLSATAAPDQRELVRFFSTALALVPDSVGAAGNLSAALVRSGQVQEAELVLRRVLKVHPREEALWFNLGQICDMRGAADEALRAFAEAHCLDASKGDNQQALARALRRVGRTAAAETVFVAGLAQNPEQVDLLLSYGAMLTDQLGRPAEAVAVFERAVELAPRRADCYSNLGQALRRLHRFDTAVRGFHAAAELDPQSAKPWWEIGNIQYEQGRYGAARDAYRAVVARDPSNAAVHDMLGNALDELGDEGAIAAYREACRLAPRAAGAWHNLGLALLNRGELTDAEAALRSAVAVAPDHTSASFLLGRCLLAQARFAEAIVIFRSLLQRADTAETGDWVMLGQALCGSGALAEAEAAFVTALEREPSHQGARQGLDEVRRRRSDERSAVERR